LRLHAGRKMGSIGSSNLGDFLRAYRTEYDTELSCARSQLCILLGNDRPESYEN